MYYPEADMKKLIYVADDERDIREILQSFLADAGYDVRVFPDGDALMAAFAERPCSLVILDVMMPGTDGLTVCQRLRDISGVPIMLLTARESETDQMLGFLRGGDDYIVKPFSPSLLVVRVNALLRRAEMRFTLSRDMRFGDLVCSPAAHTVLCGGRDPGLTVTEFDLLSCLMERPGEPVSRSELLDRVWGVEETDVETRVTDETVRRVRQKLKKARSRVRIAAVWGYGYKLEETHEEHEV